MRILLLKGGDSAEREVSLKSAENMHDALTKAGYDVVELDLREGEKKIIDLASRVDAVFLALHGAGGEDGEVQKILESIDALYLGSDSAVSEVAFDKVRTHEVLENAGINMPRFMVINHETIDRCELLNGTFVAKPIRGGSSIDTVISRDENMPKTDAVLRLVEKYGEILVEELIVGQEITVPILGTRALLPILAIPPDGEEFDYKNKYNGKSQEIVPIPLDLVTEEMQVKLRVTAEHVHQVIGARHISRVDFMVSESGDVFVLEINTLPGMTKESFYPKSAKAMGIEADELVAKLVNEITGDR